MTLVLGAPLHDAGAQALSRDTVALPAAIQTSALELVYSASRYAQEAREAPASVTIITAREIREFGYRTLADVLGAVRGFSTNNDLNYEYATVRGMARLGDFNTRILFMVDGRRINSGVSDGVTIGTDELIDLNRVARIEIIRGPGSALFGSNAFNGVVNLVTEHHVGPTGGARADAEAGSFGTYRASVAWSTRPASSREVLVSASARHRTGIDRYYSEFDTPSQNNGIAKGLDGDESYRMAARARVGDWTFNSAYSNRTRHVPTASYGTIFNDARLVTNDRAALGSVTYTHSFDDLSRLIVSSGFNSQDYSGTYPYEGALSSDVTIGRTWQVEAQYLRVFGSGHKFAVGAEERFVKNGRLGADEMADDGETTNILDVRRSQRVGAAYSQIEWRLGDKAQLYTGLRHDSYGALGSTTNPRASLIVKPTDRTTLKALYGAAFRAPNIYERTYTDGMSQKPPLQINPEHVRSVEVELEQRMGAMTGSVSAYRLTTNSLINLTVDPADSLLVFQNSGSPTARGVEMEMRGRLGRVSGRASVAFQHARSSDDSVLVNSPQQLARLGASLPLFHDVTNVALELRYTGARLTLGGSDVSAHTVTNFTFLFRPHARPFEFMLNVKDLLNSGFDDPAGAEHWQNVIPQDGRSVRAGLRITF